MSTSLEPKICPGAENCPSVQPQVKLTTETITYLRQHMTEAVSEGMMAVITPENAKQFWAVGLELMREQATMTAGRFLLDGLWDVMKKLFWIVIFITAVYLAFGSSFAASVWKAIFK